MTAEQIERFAAGVQWPIEYQNQFKVIFADEDGGPYDEWFDPVQKLLVGGEFLVIEGAWTYYYPLTSIIGMAVGNALQEMD